MKPPWRFFLLVVGLIGCSVDTASSVWSEPLLATADGGALLLTHVTALSGDVGEERCGATRITHVSAALVVRRVAAGTRALCDATRLGNRRVGFDESGRLLFTDAGDKGRLKAFGPREDSVSVLMDGCADGEAVLAADGQSRQVALYLQGCEHSRGPWLHILKLSPDARSVVSADSMRMEFPPQFMTFGPEQTRLLLQVRDTVADRIVVLDLATRVVSEVTRGELPGANSTGNGFAFKGAPQLATDGWALMYSDSLIANARTVLTMRQARALIGDSTATEMSAPVVAVDNQHVWIGFGGKVLRVHVTTRVVDVIAP